ncbi:MAG: DNA-binding response OmpR family regulator [Candidatus Omnitrophota bacterium]|jgi:DNA-binding response OmpR family regulator
MVLYLLESEGPWVAVLLDLALPGLSGLEILNRIREKNLPGERSVIILTANEQTSAIVGALLAGANDYILKSVDLVRAHTSVRCHAGTVRPTN